ncbi:hypothetical protein ACTA71_005835 [Dictyostelium dimigraforme]
MGTEKNYTLIEEEEDDVKLSISSNRQSSIESISTLPQVVIEKSKDIEEDNQDLLFPQKRVFNDKKFAIAFIIQMIVFLIMTFISIIGGSKNKEAQYGSFIIYFIIPFLSFHLISIVLLYLAFKIWEGIFRKYPSKTVDFSFYGMFIIGIPTTIVLFIYQYYVTAFFWIMLIVLLGFLYKKIRVKVPFIIELISIVLDIIKQYKSIMVVNFLSLYIFAFYLCVWSFPIGYFLFILNLNLALKIIISILLLFNIYWAYNFIDFTCSTTISGLVATWYFFSDENFNGVPKNPIIGSLYRTTSTSFGSIAFGSLTVTVVDLLRSLLSSFVNSSDSSIIKGFCLMFQISTALIRSILYKFNIYTFSMVSIYGQSFLDSAKKTENLLSVHGNKLFTSNALIKLILFAISIIVSFVVTFLSLLIIYLVQLSIGVKSTLMFGDFSTFYLFFFIFGKPFNVIFVSSITILMCISSDQNVIEQTKPNLYKKLNSLWNTI